MTPIRVLSTVVIAVMLSMLLVAGPWMMRANTPAPTILQQQIALPTATPKPGLSSTPELAPSCAAEAPGSIPDAPTQSTTYSFNEMPQRWIQEGRNPWVWVGDWLPDDQSVALVQWHDGDGIYEGYEEITVLDTETGAIQVFGRRRQSWIQPKPFWLQDLQKMGFVGVRQQTLETLSSYSGAFPNDLSLWITSSGTITPTKPFLNDVLAATGRGRQVIALQTNPLRISIVDVPTGARSVLDLSENYSYLRYSAEPQQMAWHPTLPLVALFGSSGMFLLNTESLSLSELYMLAYPQLAVPPKYIAQDAKWNPVDKLIAVIVSASPVYLSGYEPPKLLLVNGRREVCIVGLPPDFTPTDVEWTPDGNRLLVYGLGDSFLSGDAFVIDPASGVHSAVSSLPKGNGGAMVGRNFAWSPNVERAVLYQPHRFQVFDVTASPDDSLDIGKGESTHKDSAPLHILSPKEYLSQYDFSPLEEAAPVDPGGGMFGEWLPNSRAITRIGWNVGPIQDVSTYIQTWDSETGITENFGVLRSASQPRSPFWLDDAESMGFVGINGNTPYLHSGAMAEELWVTQSGTFTPTAPALTNILNATGRGHTVIALTSQPRQLIEYDVLTKQTRVLPVDVSDIGSPMEDREIRMKWHPKLPLVAISAPATFSVFNIETGTLTRLPLGPPSPIGLFDTIPAALQFEWNPVSPTLAVIVGTADYRTIGGTTLRLLDAESGLLTYAPQEISSMYKAIWAPNGRDLLTFTYDEDWYAPFQPRSYLLDTQTWTTYLTRKLVQPTEEDNRVYNAAWSPDGNRIVLNYNGETQIIEVTLPDPALGR